MEDTSSIESAMDVKRCGLAAPSKRHMIVMALVVAVHVLAIVMLAHRQRTAASAAESGNRSFLRLIPMTPALRTRSLQDEFAMPATQVVSPADGQVHSRALQPPALQPPTAQEISPPVASAGFTVPPVDWHRQAIISAESVVSSAANQPRARTFDLRDRIALPLPQTIRQSDFPWDPLHSKRAGVTPEGLFFVRLNDHCMLVLLFISCRVGSLPPRGDLFETMKDVEAEEWRGDRLPLTPPHAPSEPPPSP